MSEPEFCYLTTTGRVTGRPHTIEIWFASSGEILYLLSGGGRRSDWVRNILHDPRVTVRLGETERIGSARVVSDAEEDRIARDLVHDRYAPSYGGDLTSWRRTALPVAIELEPEGGSRA